mgnify:CR=1 FL=1|jgi:hypothetical protein|tara:strand:- start:8 stop:247 length:240 start_codon:yes stop_codon:yes gene_type:complete
MELLNTVWAIMVFATLQFSEPVTSNYQIIKFESKQDCQNFYELHQIRLTHELIHAFENLKNDRLVSLKFSCVIDKGNPV